MFRCWHANPSAVREDETQKLPQVAIISGASSFFPVVFIIYLLFLFLLLLEASQELAERIGRDPDFACCKVVGSIPGEVSKFMGWNTQFIEEEDYFLISMWLSRRLGGITRSGGGVEG